MKEQSIQDNEKKGPVPLVRQDDPHRDMTDEEILDKYIDLSNSDPTSVRSHQLVSLGILTKNNTTHTSPVMLVSRKGTKNKRPVVDFRLLNTRIMRRNTATPLLRDIFKMLGRSRCEVLSCVDLKDAFHSLGLTDKAKEFCGILPYFGSPHYRYKVLPMGLSTSPQVWITYIENLLEGNPNRQAYIAIMDDLMLHGFKSRPHAAFQAIASISYFTWPETFP